MFGIMTATIFQYTRDVYSGVMYTQLIKKVPGVDSNKLDFVQQGLNVLLAGCILVDIANIMLIHYISMPTADDEAAVDSTII